MTEPNHCKVCDTRYETVTFGHHRDRFAVWCPTCNRIGQAVDCQPEKPEPLPPRDPRGVDRFRQIQARLVAQQDQRGA